MTEIEKRAKLLAAWRKPGGSTPKEKSPPLYKTLVELLDAIADLRARNDALCAALAKIAPIVVHDGRDYAEVFFSDGNTHSTQAMTMNPQDWMDIQAAYEAAIAANKEK